MKEGDCFYDVGANHGFYALLANEFVGAKGEVHAFEPMPSVHSWLEKNASPAGVKAVDAALWDSTGTATLFLHRLGDVFNTLESEVADFDPTRGPGRAEVRCVTLDDYAAANRPPTVMKIDVEGGEKRLLDGAMDTLRKHRPAIAMEFWAGKGGERFSLAPARTLVELGYAAHALNDNGSTFPLKPEDLPVFVRDMRTGWDNVVFLPA